MRDAVGVSLGVLDARGADETALSVADGDTLALGDELVLTDGAADDDTPADGVPYDRSDGSGTLARMSRGGAPSRCGVLYENTPIPAAAATATTVPPAASNTVRRRCPRDSGSDPGSTARTSATDSGPAPTTTGSRIVTGSPPPPTAPAVSPVSPVSAPSAPSAPSDNSTYGRIRRGSKSSAAAASAVRVSRSASAARSVHVQVGVESGLRGAAHSGQAFSFDPVTRLISLPMGSRKYADIKHTICA